MGNQIITRKYLGEPGIRVGWGWGQMSLVASVTKLGKRVKDCRKDSELH